MPDISVIIPSYNRVAWIGRALDSVLDQTLPPREILVVDDGSTDDTANSVRRRYPGVTLIRQSHGGVSKARNTGIRNSGGEWIALLDSDDAWHPDKLETQAAWLAEHPHERLLHTDEIWIRDGVRVNPRRIHQKSGGDIFRRCLSLCCISPSSVLVHRSLLDEVGLFDESLPACEDYDLWLRICARYLVGYIDRPLITKYGGHVDQLSRKYWGMDRFRIRALQRLLESGVLNPAQSRAAIDMLVQKLNILMQGARKHDNRALLRLCQTLLTLYDPHTPACTLA